MIFKYLLWQIFTQKAVSSCHPFHLKLPTNSVEEASMVWLCGFFGQGGVKSVNFEKEKNFNYLVGVVVAVVGRQWKYVLKQWPHINDIFMSNSE